jgi:hypothetical protein
MIDTKHLGPPVHRINVDSKQDIQDAVRKVCVFLYVLLICNIYDSILYTYIYIQSIILLIIFLLCDIYL